ncbi:aminotransferase-like domain-containing protein [Tenacibaculum sp. M341]|uniref:aminotransferase-like domain-containing protein n=1 Tax=Tenacibaculum sp. M341 TaxID=2530339 RepID=UPI001042CCB6|nr:PLP-dependent aminotransferase family protein [Tenacibaculum sp. M341]TCI94979.1 PLP-dependent aminotransferase family protein [Tenacibaculum sp. M341]
MFPYKTYFKLDRKSSQALYIQLSNQFIQLIKEQKLPSQSKLPGTRTLADLLNVHRKTIVACYDELAMQGWVESVPKKGTFVHCKLPDFNPKELSVSETKNNDSKKFDFYTNDFLGRKFNELKDDWTYINDGICDTRLTPVDEIARTYRRVAGKKNIYKDLSYVSTYGNEKLRKVLVAYLNETRGLKINLDNILITRGSQNGIYLSSQLLLRENDVVVVGKTNYISADITFEKSKAIIKRIGVDEEGLITKDLEKLCKLHRVKAVYVTSHHHHPTTVTLSAERRIHLLNLAKEYGFAIVEDDYDYDFNYNHAPILPLACHDVNGNVIYIGSVCKTVAPVFRIGYLIAHKSFIDEAAKLRRIVDRQGDALLELTFADFIQSGDLDNHIRRVMKVYRGRRDLFCELVSSELGNYVDFEIPKGGMAVWLHLKTPYNWSKIALEARKYKLEIGDFNRYDSIKSNHNCIRVGFASYKEEELYVLISKLKKAITSCS